MLQSALEVEAKEHTALQGAVDSALTALETEGGQSGSSRLSRLSALVSQVCGCVCEALHIGVKRALAIISSHYWLNLDLVSDGYVVREEHEDNLEEEIAQYVAATKVPGEALAKLFEDEVAACDYDSGPATPAGSM